MISKVHSRNMIVQENLADHLLVVDLAETGTQGILSCHESNKV